MPRASEAFEPASADAPLVSPRVPFPPKPEPRRRAAAPSEPRLDIAPSLDATEETAGRAPAFARSGAPGSRAIPEQDEAPLSPKAEPRFAAAPQEKDELSEGLLATAFSRLDIPLRPTAPEPEPSPPQSRPFESLWPSERKAADDEPAPAEADMPDTAAAEPPMQPAEEQERPAEPYAVSILKSGVVDGMAYTLYSDGSIEAEMPQGTMRFASITELRAYLEKSSS
jgi:hypothetical protein